MRTSTFANDAVLPEIAVAKIREDAPPDKVCYIDCGVITGIGAVFNAAKAERGARCVVLCPTATHPSTRPHGEWETKVSTARTALRVLGRQGRI
jgi:hypothetical protein